MSKRKPIKKKNFFYLLTLLTYGAAGAWRPMKTTAGRCLYYDLWCLAQTLHIFGKIPQVLSWWLSGVISQRKYLAWELRQVKLEPTPCTLWMNVTGVEQSPTQQWCNRDELKDPWQHSNMLSLLAPQSGVHKGELLKPYYGICLLLT